MKTYEYAPHRNRSIDIVPKCYSDYGFGRPGHPSEYQRSWSLQFSISSYSLANVAENHDPETGAVTYKLYGPKYAPIGLSLYDMDRFNVPAVHDSMESAIDAFKRLYPQVEERARRFRLHLNARLAESRKLHGDAIVMGETAGWVVATVWDYTDPEQNDLSSAHIRMVLDPRDALAGLLADGIIVDIEYVVLSDGMETFESFGKWTGRSRQVWSESCKCWAPDMIMYRIGAGADGYGCTLARWERPKASAEAAA